ncbi:MAG: glycosyltransferase family 4 protein [Promethearchaeota archaeon]
MEIKTFIGRKLSYVNGIFRRQIELDRYLMNLEDVKLTYEYYSPPRNPIDFISKRYFLYPYYCKRSDKSQNTINHITFQLLGDLGHFLDKSRTIITCHDIFTFLERNNFKNPYFLQKYYASGLKKCRFVIAISEFTKSELVKKLKIPKEKIIVIKNGMNREIFYPLSNKELESVEPLYTEYKKILHMGSEVDRKNFLTLLKAFYLIKKRDKNYKLIRIGKPAYTSFIKTLGLQKDVIYLSNISNKRLREIYNLVDFYVYPSTYEGWGAGGLEAASCGTPVLCSDIPVFREIYRDFPIYFPPYDFRQLAKLILNNIDNVNLKLDMRKKGIEVVNKYSWEKSAMRYLKLARFVIESQK